MESGLRYFGDKEQRSQDPSKGELWELRKKTHPQLGTPIHAALAAQDATASCPGLRRPPPETQPQGSVPSLAPPRPAARPHPPALTKTPLGALPRLYSAEPPSKGGGALKAESK